MAIPYMKIDGSERPGVGEAYFGGRLFCRFKIRSSLYPQLIMQKSCHYFYRGDVLALMLGPYQRFIQNASVFRVVNQ